MFPTMQYSRVGISSQKETPGYAGEYIKSSTYA